MSDLNDRPEALPEEEQQQDEILTAETLVERFRAAAARLDPYAPPRATP